MIKYDPGKNEICIVTENGETVVYTHQAMEAVAQYFEINFGCYENRNGKLNYEYKN